MKRLTEYHCGVANASNALEALKMRWAEDNKKEAITMTENEAIKIL